MPALLSPWLCLRSQLRKRNRPASQSYFTDVVLVDEDGKLNPFYSDLLKEKVAVIYSFFASCKDSCPLLAGTAGKVHLTTFVIGRKATGQWAKASGLEGPSKVLALVDRMLNELDGN